MFGAFRAGGQWHEDAWAGHRACVTQELWATVHTATVTNWTSPTNFALTNLTFLANIQPRKGDASPISSTYKFYTPAFLTNGRAYMATQTLTESKSLVQTNLVLRDREVCLWDLGAAVNERLAVMRQTNFYGHYYFGEHEALQQYKGSIYGMMQSTIWADKRRSDGTAFPIVAQSNALPTISETLEHPDRMGGFDIPTNFFGWTPWQIFLTNSPYGHILTSTVSFALPAGVTVTQTVCDSCGDCSHTVVATNGQRFTFFCTNYVTNAVTPVSDTGVAPGWTSDAYTYGRARMILTNIVWSILATPLGTSTVQNVGAQGVVLGGSYPYCGDAGNCNPHRIRDGLGKTYNGNTWTSHSNAIYTTTCDPGDGNPVQTNVQTVSSFCAATNAVQEQVGCMAAVSKYSIIDVTDIHPECDPLPVHDEWTAREKAFCKFGVPWPVAVTGGTLTIAFYARASIPNTVGSYCGSAYVSPPVTNSTFNPYSTGLTTNFEPFVTHSWNSTNTTLMVGDDDLTTPPTWPAVSDGSASSIDGYVMDAVHFQALIKWDSSKAGFKYK